MSLRPASSPTLVLMPFAVSSPKPHHPLMKIVVGIKRSPCPCQLGPASKSGRAGARDGAIEAEEDAQGILQAQEAAHRVFAHVSDAHVWRQSVPACPSHRRRLVIGAPPCSCCLGAFRLEGLQDCPLRQCLCCNSCPGEGTRPSRRNFDTSENSLAIRTFLHWLCWGVLGTNSVQVASCSRYPGDQQAPQVQNSRKSISVCHQPLFRQVQLQELRAGSSATL